MIAGVSVKESLKKSPNMENVPVHGIEIPIYS